MIKKLEGWDEKRDEAIEKAVNEISLIFNDDEIIEKEFEGIIDDDSNVAVMLGFVIGKLIGIPNEILKKKCIDISEEEVDKCFADIAEKWANFEHVTYKLME